MRIASGSWSSLCVAAALVSACRDDPTTGSLVITVHGLPDAARAAVVVAGPNQFSREVSATTTLDRLPPGDYTVRAQTVTHSHAPFAAAVDETRHQITAGHTEGATVAYALSGGSIDLAVTGLPAGTPARITLTGPDRVRDVTAAGVVEALPTGTHVIRADTTENAAGDRFGSSVVTQAVVVGPSLTPVPASARYALSSGTLELAVDGLPASPDPAPVTVAGPGSVVRRVGASTTLRGLPPGTYSIDAAVHHESCPLVYAPAQSQQVVDVAIGATISRAVSYSRSTASSQTLNLKIDAAHLVQVTQDLGGGVPLIAGREALLRVYGTANENNAVRPRIRVTLSNGSVASLAASGAFVRRIAEPGLIAGSWNVVVPATAVQKGLTVFAEIDPDNRICEADETDNRFPANGALPVAVRTGPTIPIRFVPVRVASSGYVGAINADNLDAFLSYSRKVHPVSAYDADIRLVPYTTTRGGFQPGDQNGSWGGVLSELSALRVAEGDGRYYHGIVRVTYNSGVAGIGLIGGKTALTWDYLPSASEIVAHELGHNYARFHAPCGNPGGVDSEYPTTGDYAGGKIGQVGYDFATEVLKVPTEFADFMSYCRPAWTSDYTYKAILNRLAADFARAPAIAAQQPPEPSLLIWGRIVDGTPVLEPAFELAARATLPARSGPHRLTVRDEAGAEVLAIPFAAERVADIPTDVETFAFAVPLSMLRGRTAASLTLTARGRSVRVAPVSAIAGDPATRISRVGPRSVRLQWDASRFPMLMVRDPVGGDVLSFARDGDVVVETARGELEISYSNRVRSRHRRVVVP